MRMPPQTVTECWWGVDRKLMCEAVWGCPTKVTSNKRVAMATTHNPLRLPTNMLKPHECLDVLGRMCWVCCLGLNVRV